MNKYLIKFFEDEVANNGYYESIRQFHKDSKGDWNSDILSPIVNSYEDNMDNFGPYRFVDAIEDYLENMYDTESDLLKTAKSLDDVIAAMWEDDYFEKY